MSVPETKTIDQSSTALAPQQAQPVARASEAGSIIDMIDRAARDETVNIDKMRELLAMRKEIKAQEAEEAFRDALSLAQGEMTPVIATSKGDKSKYASYAALDNMLRPIYTRHGFSISFNTEPTTSPDMVRVTCEVGCKGHKQKYQVDMPADGKGAKGNDVMTRTHATGSAMTYGKRYLLGMIFNIAVARDDDGALAGAKHKEAISDDAAEKMRETVLALVTEMKMDIDKFLIWAKAPSISDIPGADLPDVIANLQERKRKLAAKKGAAQ